MSWIDVNSFPLMMEMRNEKDKDIKDDVKSHPIMRTRMMGEKEEEGLNVQGIKSFPVTRTETSNENDEKTTRVQHEKRMSVQDKKRMSVQDEKRMSVQDERRMSVQDERRMSVQDVRSLPILRTEIREKKDCPGVTEKVEYRLRAKEDGNGEEIELSYVNDEILEKPIAVNINLAESWLKSSMVILTRPYINCLDQEDKKLIKIIREDYLKHPSKSAGNPYKFSVPVKDLDYHGDARQAEDLDDLFDNNLFEGFFIEAGSLDSEHMSTSLLLAVNRNWTGLLIEPTPHCHTEGLLKNRRATHIQTCLASERRPHYVMFDINEIFQPDNMGKKPMGGIQDSSRSVEMQCLPIYSIIQAVGNITIHYFSLDIAGTELQVN